MTSRSKKWQPSRCWAGPQQRRSTDPVPRRVSHRVMRPVGEQQALSQHAFPLCADLFGHAKARLVFDRNQYFEPIKTQLGEAEICREPRRCRFSRPRT